jgi:hypothetical protein
MICRQRAEATMKVHCYNMHTLPLTPKHQKIKMVTPLHLCSASASLTLACQNSPFSSSSLVLQRTCTLGEQTMMGYKRYNSFKIVKLNRLMLGF